jgi:hypothetical protein
MVAPLLPHAPIDEVVVGFVLDQPIGPDAVEAGMYLVERGDVFTQHEIHEAIVPSPGWIDVPGPLRVWLVSADGAWLVQLQHDRFHANWRRRGESPYPGFHRSGGAMHYAISEFTRFQDFCARLRGKKPNAASVEMSKIDLLVQGRHWQEVRDVAELVPVLAPILTTMATPGPTISVQTQERVDDTTVTISLTPARMKANPSLFAFRLEFRATQPAGEDMASQLVAINATLNEAFARVVPDYQRRFS